MKLLKSHKCYGGLTQFWEHESTETKTTMKLSTHVPDGKIDGCVIWLSGLTCTEENFITKAGAQRYLQEEGLIVVCPDTSPRGTNLPGEHDSWDYGSGAGFYVDATTPGYRDHYRMYSYVSKELYALVQQQFGVGDKISIMGHSMGGHGALILGLREPKKFKAVSAFSPIVNPVAASWGKKAFAGYLGPDVSEWKHYDACELIKSGHKHPHKILVDQGTEDSFLDTQLLTRNLLEVCERHGQPLEADFDDGYDHSYYFIASFIERHLAFHGEALRGN